MKLHELNVEDWIQFRISNRSQSMIGKIMYFTCPFEDSDIKAIVKLTDGRKIEIDTCTDFAKLDLPYKQKIDHEEVAENKKDIPDHYTGGEIDLIEYFYQQRGLDAMVDMTSFNIQRYASRLGRKDEMVSELNKIIDYAERLKEKLI